MDADNEPSLTVKVISVSPGKIPFGKIAAVRLAPVPLSTMPVFGTSFPLLEDAVTVSELEAVSTSPMVKGTSKKPPTRTICFATGLMVGASFTGVTVKPMIDEVLKLLLSVAVKVTLFAPDWFSSGVMTTVAMPLANVAVTLAKVASPNEAVTLVTEPS